ncbi:MAG: hypothetical protein IKQ60_06575 [Candidatus Methanomethylophilaceae archaeon]|nr:hypothetical protein [Candidatus Methanomethylophilaceae archaeon]
MGSDDIITDSAVENMIEAPKLIEKAVELSDLQTSNDGRQRFGTYDLECELYDFKMIIRQNIDRPDNFSVILVCILSKRRDITILRYNGNHGSHKNRLENETIKGPHIHKLTERYQERTTHPDGYAIPTDEYRTLSEAVGIFMRDARIRVKGLEHNKTLEDYYDCQ